MPSLNTDPRFQTRNGICKSNRNLTLDIVSAFGIPASGPLGKELREHLTFGNRRAEIEILKAEAPGCLSGVLLENPFRVEPIVIVELSLQGVAENLVSL